MDGEFATCLLQNQAIERLLSPCLKAAVLRHKEISRANSSKAYLRNQLAQSLQTLQHPRAWGKINARYTGDYLCWHSTK
jgi:hypothetical protein